MRRLVLVALVVISMAIAWQLLDRYRTWHLWEGFKRSYVTHDGRVVDHLQDGRATSEGQAYALFFALVANDKPAFRAILAWTEQYLSDGPVEKRLPAWLWGQDDEGQWRVLDPNSATDADLWIAYTLLEAGRLWHQPEYIDKGRELADLVLEKNLINLEEYGPMLLPAPVGFRLESGLWRFNPSYLPPFMLRRFSLIQPDAPWQAIQVTAAKLLHQSARRGLVPDWYLCCRDGEVLGDSVGPKQGSYDAIRVYLWLALSAAGNPQHGATFARVQGMARVIENIDGVPERVDLETGRVEGQAPVGFVAAMLPYLQISGKDMLLSRLEKRVEASWRSHTVGERAQYYDFALGLFALGWLHGQYNFDAEGRLLTRWSGYGV